MTANLTPAYMSQQKELTDMPKNEQYEIHKINNFLPVHNLYFVPHLTALLI